MSNSEAKTCDSKANVCDLCSEAFKASDEVLPCEGHSKNLSLCIATVLVSSDSTNKTLTDNSTSFVCLVCTQLLHKC